VWTKTEEEGGQKPAKIWGISWKRESSTRKKPISGENKTISQGEERYFGIMVEKLEPTSILDIWKISGESDVAQPCGRLG